MVLNLRMTIQVFFNGMVYTPSQVIPDGVVVIQDNQVRALGARAQGAHPADAQLIDARGGIIAPGLVDIHTYGCLGVSITSPETAGDELDAFAKNVARFGVTSFLISPTMGDRNFIASELAALAEAMPRVQGGATPLGIHLEGPWLDPEQRGAFPVSVLHAPTLDEAREYLDAARGYLKLVTLAGNLPNASEVAHFFGEHGVRVSYGHSNTTYEHAHELLSSGAFPLVTHVYNAMSGLHHRKPGVLGAVLSSDNVMGMLICDGIHAHPAAVKILLRSLGLERVILVTDAIPGGGMNGGEFTMLNQTARIVEGVARLQDGTIAGSILTLNRAVMNARAFADLAWSDALALATHNPARALGLASKGALAPGADADVIVMDTSGNVTTTMVAGHVVHQTFA